VACAADISNVRMVKIGAMVVLYVLLIAWIIFVECFAVALVDDEGLAGMEGQRM
jgi:hypothetical protein